MSRLNLEDNELRKPTVANGLRLGTLTKVLTGPITIAADAPTMQTLDANGAARSVIMPDETVVANRGLAFFIKNGAAGAFALNIRNSGDTTTVGSIAQNLSAWVILTPNLGGAATYIWTVHPA